MMRLRRDPKSPTGFRLVHVPTLEDRFLLALTLDLDKDANRRQAVVLAHHAWHRVHARELGQELWRAKVPGARRRRRA